MPRKKASVPQRLNEDQREQQSFNLGEGSGANHEVIDLINDEVEDYDSDEDADFVPIENLPKRSSKASSKPRKKGNKSTENKETEENLTFLLETADFCVGVNKSRPEFCEWSGAILSTFHIELLEDEKFDFSSNDFWIYLSNVPDINFIYIDKSRYQRIGNISSLNYQLLKAFEQGKVGAKRRNIILVLGEIQGKRLEINVEVHESTLFKFMHPSDIVSYVPESVKKSMEYFLQVRFCM